MNGLMIPEEGHGMPYPYNIHTYRTDPAQTVGVSTIQIVGAGH
jgi:hypothetical protein